MKIEILCSSGSQIGVSLKSLYGEDNRIGVGGSEYALLTMCEEWTKRGDQVTLYNDPKEPKASPFEQKSIFSFNPQEDRDVLIIFRSPTELVNDSKGMKIWWSQDQRTSGNYGEFSKCVDKIVCISNFHAEYFKNQYGITNTIVIDDPVRVGDYKQFKDRIKNKFLFSSVPDRGLKILLDIWPEIRATFADASLVITSDYRLWSSLYPLNEKYREQAMGLRDIKFKGAIKRSLLIEEQLTSDIMAYPCIYEELQCIAVAEAEVSGVFPISSTVGALGTTNMRLTLEGDPKTNAWQQEFLGMIYDFLKSPQKEFYRKQVKKLALKRFDPVNILDQWDKKVFN